MVERHRTVIESAPIKSGTVGRYREDLVIDKDKLDDCLVQQPELYYHVAEAFSQAVAERDALKYEIELAEAEEGKKIRDRAVALEEKLTEANLKEQLLLLPRLNKLRLERLHQETLVGSWQALKEAYQQRSYMLRELVPMYLSRLSSGSVRIGSPRDQLSDTIHEMANEGRRSVKDYKNRNG